MRDVTQLTLDNVMLWGLVAFILIAAWFQFASNPLPPAFTRVVKLLVGAGGCGWLLWKYFNQPAGSVPVSYIVAWLWFCYLFNSAAVPKPTSNPLAEISAQLGRLEEQVREIAERERDL